MPRSWFDRGRPRKALVFLALVLLANAPAVAHARADAPPPTESPTAPGRTPSRDPETHVIPSIRIAERYDSNVYFVSGKRLDDYVTTIAPQVRVEHKNGYVDGSFGGGFSGELFAKNPGLNYAAVNGTLDMRLDGIIERLVPSLHVRVMDTFLFTPQLPSFATSGGDGQLPESFARGLQAQRANSITNVGKIDANYVFSPILSFSARYTDQRVRFANSFASPLGRAPGGLIDTTSHIVESGPVFKLTPSDTVTLSYLYQHGSFNLGNSPNTFSAQGGTATWTRELSRSLAITGMGGFSIVSSRNTLQPLAGAIIKWQEGNSSATLSYTRMIIPSFLFLSTPLLSQVVSGSFTHKLSAIVSLSISANYAVNYSVPDSFFLNFRSYSVTPSISYVLGKTTTASLSYTRSQYQNSFVGQNFEFDRDIVLLSFLMEWK